MDRRDSADVLIGVLGWIRASVDGEPVELGGPRQRALLAALAARGGGRTVPSEVLVEAVWDGDPPAAAARTLRSYVARLRRSFDRAGATGTEVVQTVSGGYRLADATSLDADLFESEVGRAPSYLERGELAHVLRLTERALGRWEGPAFGGVADRQWAAPAAVRLEELRRDATELRARALLDTERVAGAVALLEEHVRAEPYREQAVRLLALALYRSGRDADALRVLRDFRDRLVEEHGLDPSEELSELEVLVLNRDPRLDRPVVGRRLHGYVVHEPIASSALGTVHRAEQPSIGREVAVTVLPPSVADHPQVVRAFETRLQVVAGLHHPHVLPIYDYWREPGGAYVVTRLPAATLRTALEAGEVTAADAVAVGEQVASAVAAAHERGVVHGAPDIDAVVVDERGDAYLWAFPIVPESGRPAADVGEVARLVRTIAAQGGAAGDGVATEVLPPRVRRVLDRAQEPTRGPVVTAAGLAAALAAVRTGMAHPAVVTELVGPNPYRGLAAFGEADADVFFGRTELVKQLVARIRRTRAVVVVGPSGAGKSSVARAGVLPELRAEGAFVTTMVPGDRPLDELEVALARVAATPVTDAADAVAAGGLARLVREILPTPGADLVLVVDQLEELFTQSDPTERDLFLSVLADTVADHDAPVRVVATLRADFLGQALAHPTAARFVRDRTVMVAPLDDDELHEVIVGPAEVAGAAVEPALVAALVADATRARGSLPMVQFALTEVFAAADEGVMRLATYRRIGGIEGVLGQRAEEVFASLAPDGQAAARLLFLRLVAPQPEGPATRRRALRRELAHVPDAVVEAFGRARLLRFDHDDATREPTVEVTHEALFEAWPRLAGWIEEGADDLRVLGHLSSAAATWESGGRRDADLYRGARLDDAVAFAAGHDGQLAARERDFLAASSDWQGQEEAAATRTVRRLRLRTAGIVVGLALALVAGLVALDQRQQLTDEQREALAQDLAAASRAAVEDDPELAVLLALEAVDLSRRAEAAVLPEAEQTLHDAVTASRVALRVQGRGGSVDWHPDGTVFVTEGPHDAGLVDLRDASTGETVREFTGHEADITDVAFSPDGRLLATADDGGLLRVWGATSDVLVTELRGEGEVWGISFSADGSRVSAAWRSEGLVRVLDLVAGGAPVEVQAETVELSDSTSLSPDGRQLAVADAVVGVRVVDVGTGEQLLTLDAPSNAARAVAWSPDGRWIASGGDVPVVSEAASGQLHRRLRGHTGDVVTLDWDTDGGRLSTGSVDGRARVFEVDDDGADEQVSVAVSAGMVRGVAFSPDGERLLTGDVETTDAAVWHVGIAAGAEVVNLPAFARGPTDAVFTPAGDEVLVAAELGRAVAFDVATGTPGTRYDEQAYGGADGIEISPDGASVLAVRGDNVKEVQVWDRLTGERRLLLWPEFAVFAATWVPGSDQIAVAGIGSFGEPPERGVVAVYEVTGELVDRVVGEPSRILWDLAFHPDGRRTVTASVTGRDGRIQPDPSRDTVRVWDVAGEEVLGEIPEFALGVEVDPTGQHIAVVRGGVRIHDADSLEQLVELDGHAGEVHDVAFSADGERVATAGADGTVRVWGTSSGDEQLVLRGHQGPVWSVGFGPDGDRLVSSGGGVARVWALDLDELVEIAESRVTRPLSDAECRRHLGRPCP